jgi:UDP-GlcNAc:undecaprenyl-phosphate GlcNAc-1-phosphate transferase
LIAIQYIDLRIAMIGLAGAFLALAGFIDDVEPISPAQKYVPQVIGSLLAAFALEPTLAGEFLFLQVNLHGNVANLLAALWIVSFINVLNFMDGIDGLAAGVGAILGIAIPALTNGAGAFMLLPLAAALLGFLAWNTNPASIFMGDVGSQFVGLVLAVGALHWPAGDVQMVPVLIVFAPLLLDTGFTLIRRLVNGQNIFRAHRTHLYQRLVSIGYTHRGVANLYYFMTAISLALGVAYMRADPTTQLLLVVLMVVLGASYIFVVDRLERGTLKWGFLMPSSGLMPSVPRSCESEVDIEGASEK